MSQIKVEQKKASTSEVKLPKLSKEAKQSFMSFAESRATNKAAFENKVVAKGHLDALKRGLISDKKTFGLVESAIKSALGFPKDVSLDLEIKSPKPGMKTALIEGRYLIGDLHPANIHFSYDCQSGALKLNGRELKRPDLERFINKRSKPISLPELKALAREDNKGIILDGYKQGQHLIVLEAHPRMPIDKKAADAGYHRFSVYVEREKGRYYVAPIFARGLDLAGSNSKTVEYVEADFKLAPNRFLKVSRSFASRGGAAQRGNPRGDDYKFVVHEF